MGKKSRGCLIVAGIGIGMGVCLLLVAVLGAIIDSPSTPQPSAAGSNTAEPTQVSETTGENTSIASEPTDEPEIPTQVVTTEEVLATAEVVIVDNAPSFEEICGNSTTGGQTEVVWDNFKKETEGKYFIDRLGVVKNVDQGLFGGYNLIVDVGKSYGSCSVDVYIDVTEEESKALKVGQDILFSGKISSLAEFFSDVTVSLNDGTYITDPEIVGPLAESQKPPVSTIGEVSACGSSFTITILEQPEFLNALGYGNTASGKYLVLKLEVVNNTGKTFDGFQEENFVIDGNLSGNPVQFVANWDPSYYAARRQYGYKFMSEELPPGLPWKTQVVFDINPDATDLVFGFLPKDNMFDSNNMCETRVSLADAP